MMLHSSVELQKMEVGLLEEVSLEVVRKCYLNWVLYVVVFD